MPHMKFIQLLIATCLAAPALPAIAVTATDLSVSGRLLPTSCNMSLNKSEISLGTIPASTLNEGTETLFQDHSVSIMINCDGPTRFALATTDHRADSSTNPMTNSFGLGKTPAGENIGTYYIFPSEPSDAVAGELKTIGSADNGASWNASSFLDTATVIGFKRKGDSASQSPLALDQVTIPLVMQAWIVAANSLTLTSEVPIDGQLTLELKYL